MEESVNQVIQKALSENGKTWYDDLSDLHFVLLGATSEMGPLDFLLDRGANVIALARKGE